ncbi:MAG TPA: hypothetical protein VLG74_13955 [Blastocatellia bacterium]|nr:hypothetical protein [Blastocatellia bacterium]
MKRIAIVVVAATILAQCGLAADVKAQQSRLPRTPALTTDDLSPSGSSPLRSEEKAIPVRPRGSTLDNARQVLASVLTRMTEAESFRTRIQTFLPTGQREVLIETMKPDRMHVVSPEGELIAIGGTFYLKNRGSWRVTTVPGRKAGQSDSGLDFGTLVKQMTGRSGILISGHLLGDRVLDGVECVVYEFEVTDRSETGTIEVSVGKGDGYMRRLSISDRHTPVPRRSGSLINVWFTNINEPLSIQPPM